MKAREFIERTDDHHPKDPTKFYACGKCGRLSSPHIYMTTPENALIAAREMAERCCEPKICDCGQLCKGHYMQCQSCIDKHEAAREASRREKAHKYTLETAPDGPYYWHDKFFGDLGELFESHDFEELEEDSFPIIFWLCNKETPALDFGRVTEMLHESLELDSDCELSAVVTSLDDLEKFIDTFNSQQTDKVWRPAHDGYVEITWTDRQKIIDAAPPTPEPTPEKEET